MIHIVNKSYITISGLEIRNYTTSNSNAVPVGIWVSGSGSNIQILNNHIHHIVTTAEANGGNALGIAIYGTNAPKSLDSITIRGNEIDNLRTGWSESVSVNGNVTNFKVVGNEIHDNDNIGIDIIGHEGTAPDPNYDSSTVGSRDFAGNSRIQSSFIDLGAYEQ